MRSTLSLDHVDAYRCIKGLVFFHEHGLKNIPLIESNIIMDTGMAPPDQPLDRVAFPVKYYLSSLYGIIFPEDKPSTDVHCSVHTDVNLLGSLLARVFPQVSFFMA